jgi:diketogulonate reductase-like aldo/keto reductase
LTSDLLDYIDLFLIHGPLMGPEKRVDTWRNLVDFMHQSEGKIRAVGVSNFGIAHLEALREEGLEVPSVNQIEVSIIIAHSAYMASTTADSGRTPCFSVSRLGLTCM